ncbi:MAG: hypothetical protein J6Q33_00810 [Alistipes sp.]|nr:hypothetical protein [Alistipes sp.]
MRTIQKFFWAMLPVLCLTLAASCTKDQGNTDKPAPTPQVEKDSTIKLGKSSMSVSLAGGSYLLEYTIEYNGEGENPHKGEKITAEPAESWVNNFNYSIPGALQFNVDANTTSEERQCLVTIKYRYAEDVVFVVKQGAAVSAGFKLENVTSTYFDYTVDVIPDNKTLPYIVMSAAPEYIVASGFENGQDYYEDDLAYFGWLGQFYGMSAVQIMQERAKVGDQPGILVSNGASGVPYTFYCYYFDYESGALLSDVHMFTVTTAKPDLSNVEFTIETEVVDGCMVKANVVPVGYQGDYYFDVLNENLINSYMEEEVMSFLDTRERMVEYWWSTSVQEMMKELSADQIIANYTCQGNNPDGSSKSYYEFELLANSTYYLFAFTMEENALCSSVPQLVKIETGDVAMSDNEITPSVSKLTARTADFTFTPTNNDYYVAGWEKASDWATYGNNDAERQEYLLANMEYYLLSGTQTTSVLNLEADTEYVLYAFGSRGGVATTSQIFTQTFKTKSGEAGNVTISFKDLGYYDAAEFANCPGYEYLSNYSGNAVFPIEVEFSDEEHGDWFWNIYDWTGRTDIYTDQQYMDGLIWSINEYGSMTATHTYTFLEFGGEYEIAAVVLDTEGQFSSLYRRWVKPTYDGVGNVENYVAWWDAYQNGQSAGLQSLDSSVFFQAKGSKAKRVSEMTFEKSKKVIANDEIPAR